MKEALCVFGKALIRLEALGGTNRTQAADADLNLEAGDSIRPRLDALASLASTHPSLESRAR